MIDIGSWWFDWLGKQSDSIEARLAYGYQSVLVVFSEDSGTVDIGSVNGIAYDGL